MIMLLKEKVLPIIIYVITITVIAMLFTISQDKKEEEIFVAKKNGLYYYIKLLNDYKEYASQERIEYWEEYLMIDMSYSSYCYDLKQYGGFVEYVFESEEYENFKCGNVDYE
ncbi:MAG: hypothetical protein PHU94_03485 [Bacilli bacterium]|nr:hypothetical protein [Bacilli bacterium]